MERRFQPVLVSAEDGLLTLDVLEGAADISNESDEDEVARETTPD